MYNAPQDMSLASSGLQLGPLAVVPQTPPNPLTRIASA